jgi:hypothetical protein
VLALFAMFVLLFATVPAFLPRAQAQTGGSQTYYLSNSEYDDCNYALVSSVPGFNTVTGNNDFCTNYAGSTQTITTVSVTLNYYTSGVGESPTATATLYDDSQESTLAQGTTTISEGGSCEDPLTVTFTLTVNSPAQLRSGDEVELDLTYNGAATYWTVLGSGTCDPTTPTQVTLNFQSSAPPAPTNVCQTGVSECYTTFAAFNVISATGAPVGGATVVVSETGFTTQTAATASVASTSPLCTLSTTWSSEWGAYWGCNIGSTGPFTLDVGVTYSYTVTLPSGTVLTGSIGPSTTPGTTPWTVTLVTVTA